MKTENLYLDSAFGDWLRQCPVNVEHNYSELNVDLHGTRVSVCFSVPDEQETTAMNLFYVLRREPVAAAQALCDKHVVK
jgi:hypothetical protein